MRVVFAGEPIADSLGALILLESRHTPVYYFPRQDVRLDCMTRTDHRPVGRPLSRRAGRDSEFSSLVLADQASR